MNLHENVSPAVPLVRYAETAPLFTLDDLRRRYGNRTSNRSISDMVYRLKRQGRVRAVSAGVYTGTLGSAPFNRFALPAKLRPDAVIAFHTALEFAGMANQTFQVTYYLSRRPRRDVIYEGGVFHRAAPFARLLQAKRADFLVEAREGGIRATTRERSLVDCLACLEYSGGIEELDRCLAAFPSFDFEAALEYLRLLEHPWLYSRLGYLLDRHGENLYFLPKYRDKFLRRVPRGVVYLEKKEAGQRWIPTWNLMAPPAFPEVSTQGVRT
jgi:predicted transcriptional regulator of viral defense system